GPSRWQGSSAASRLTNGGFHSEQRVDEHEAAIAVNGHVVHVDVPGDIANLGHVDPIETVLRLAALQDVLEAPQLPERADPQAVAVRRHAHAPRDGALV